MRMILAIIMLACNMAHAQTIGVHTLTHHIDSHTGLNERNIGLYLRSDNWTVGGYRNSYRRTTLYAGYVLDYGPFSVTLGAATGYQRKWRDCTAEEVQATGFVDECRKPDTKVKTALMPVIAPSVALPIGDGWKARLTVVPEEYKPALVHLSFERQF